MTLTRAVAIGAGLLTAFLAPGCNNSMTPVELTITVTGVSPATGPLAGGTSVTITGSNFIDVTSVTIGDRELSGRTVMSSTQIIGTAPAATSTGARDVVVTSSSHGAGTCSGCFTYLSIPAVAIATGGAHTCGLSNTGAAYCWGDNNWGQLGNGSFTNSSIPVAVSAGLGFSALATGGVHTCALTSAGAAYCWGYNGFGQLGNSAVGYSLTPLAVSGNLSFSALATAVYYTCGRTGSGAAYCWGDNEAGQLGDGSSTFSRPAPGAVSGGLSFSALATGENHTCGLTSSGAAYCWGLNNFGQLGDGTTTNSSVPVPVAGLP